MGTINRVLVCFLSGAAVFGVFAAAPALVDGSVTLTQDPHSQQVTVSYELKNAPAVVTVDFLTNGVSIGSRNIGALAGDVNKVVSPGVNTLYWHPAKSWPNRTVGGEGLCAKVTLWPTDAPPDYMVIDLTLGPSDTSIPVSERIRYYTCAEAVDLPGGIEGDLCKTDYLVLRKIHAAGKTFCMGSVKNVSDGYVYDGITVSSDSVTPHMVQFTNDYYIGVYEFTQQQWRHLGTTNWFYFTEQGARRPVEGVGGVRIRGYMDDKNNSAQKIWPRDGHAVTEKYGKSYTAICQLRKIAGGLPIDLPTESQWEFAARAGKGGVMPDGSPVFDAEAMGAYGRFPTSPDLPAGVTVGPQTPPDQGGTAVVGSYPPNAWGLYDMFGNVMEMCLDLWQTKQFYDPAVVAVDPVGPYAAADNLKYRVYRGGHWNSVWATTGRSFENINFTNGSSHTKYAGFRVCLTLP